MLPFIENEELIDHGRGGANERRQPAANPGTRPRSSALRRPPRGLPHACPGAELHETRAGRRAVDGMVRRSTTVRSTHVAAGSDACSPRLDAG
jgi:hypothetical protein